MRFKMTPAMKAAIRRHSKTQVSLYLIGGSFGKRIKARVDELGALLRVSPATKNA
jgi:hypothetical protein